MAQRVTAASASMHKSTYAAGNFSHAKAGMAESGGDAVARIIEEASKGSKFYENAQQREQALNERLAKLSATLSAIPDTEIARLDAQMAAYMGHCEAQRHLTRVFVVCDMDAFFAACAEREDPSLKGLAFAVGSIGMISTASYEARKYQVRSAMPGFIALKLCPHLRFVAPHFGLYEAAAAETREIFAQYDPDFTAGSLDEAFLDITSECVRRGILPLANAPNTVLAGGHDSSAEAACRPAAVGGATCSASAPHPSLAASASTPVLTASVHMLNANNPNGNGWGGAIYKAPHRELDDRGPDGVGVPPSDSQLVEIEAIVAEMRAVVKERTRGLTCSAGIAANPMLGKIASNLRKPDGQASVPFEASAIRSFMAQLPVRKVPGIGRVMERTLAEIGVLTCGDLLAKKGVVRAAFSEHTAHWLIRAALGISSGFYGNGDDDSDHEDGDGAPSRKSISQERTFADCGDWPQLASRCEDLAAKVAKQMQEEAIVGRTVTVKIKLATFEVIQRGESLPRGRATSDIETIQKLAVSLLHAALQEQQHGNPSQTTKQTSLIPTEHATALDSTIVSHASADGSAARKIKPMVKLRLLGVRVSGLSKAGVKGALDKFVAHDDGPTIVEDDELQIVGFSRGRSVATDSGTAAPKRPRGIEQFLAPVSSTTRLTNNKKSGDRPIQAVCSDDDDIIILNDDRG